MQLSSSCHSHAVNYLSVTSREFCSGIYQFRFHSHRSTERLSKFNMSRALKSEQKEKNSTMVLGKYLLAVLPTGFWKTLMFHVFILMKEILTGNLRA